MEQNRRQNFAVGLTTLAGLIGFGLLIMIFGYVPQFLQTGYLVHITFPTAGGLHGGSRAQLSGIEVGQVMDIELTDGPEGGVVVTVQIEEDFRLPIGTTAEIASGSLLGGSPRVAFRPNPDADPDQFLPTDGTARIEGETGSIAQTLGRQVEQLAEQPLRDLEQISQNIDRLTGSWVQVGDNLARLTEERDLAAVDSGAAQGNLTTMLARADARLHDAEQVLSSMQALFGDEQFRSDLKTTVGEARAMTESIDERLSALQRRYVAVADDFSQVAGSTQDLLQKASRGEGTIGRLLNEAGLYENLNDTTQRLQAMLDEARLLIQKWKAEGLPVQF